MADSDDMPETRELTMQLRWQGRFGYSAPELQQATKITRFYEGEVYDERLEWNSVEWV